jgi:hypothetical protein
LGFGADSTRDATRAIQAALSAVSRGGEVRIPIEQKHADACVTAQLTHVTGYERVFQAESTHNCIVISSHYGRLPQARSVFDRRIDIIGPPGGPNPE